MKRAHEGLPLQVYETSSGKVTLCAEPSPIDRFIRELVARAYPQGCVDYYRNKVRGLGATAKFRNAFPTKSESSVGNTRGSQRSFRKGVISRRQRPLD